MFRPTLKSVGLLCGTSVLISAVVAGDDPAEVTVRQVTANLEQTREGVTAKVEKVVLEHVLNGAGWLRNKFGPDWRKIVPTGFTPESFRVVSVFVSVSGPLEGGMAGSFELTRGQLRMTGVSGFDPPDWQARLPDVAVNPEARGWESWAVLDDDSMELLPSARAKLGVTAAGGKTVEFVFADLTP